MLFIDIYKKQFNDRIKQQDNKDIDIWYCYWWLYLRSGQSGLKEVLSWLTRDNIKRPEPSFQNKRWSAVVIHKTYIHQSFFIGYIMFSPLQHIFYIQNLLIILLTRTPTSQNKHMKTLKGIIFCTFMPCNIVSSLIDLFNRGDKSIIPTLHSNVVQICILQYWWLLNVCVKAVHTHVEKGGQSEMLKWELLQSDVPKTSKQNSITNA